MMKKIWKRALACMLVLALVAGYLPAKMNSVVNAEDSNTEEVALEFGETDTYLQLSDPLSAAPQAIEATVNMPEIEKEWVLCAADEISVNNATSSEVQTVEDTIIVGPKAGSSYKSITMPSDKEFVFQHKFNDVQIPYTLTKEDVALAFWMYNGTDAAVTIDSGYIELTSSGTCDHNEICWKFAISSLALTTGWNYVELPVSGMIKGSADADFNLQELNYLRWHSLEFTEETTIGLTDVKLVVVEEEENDENFADGEWTLADVNGTIPIETTDTNAPQGSKVVQKEVTSETSNVISSSISCTLPDTYDLKVTAKDAAMSGDDADNLILDFWVCTPSDYTDTVLRFWLYLYYGGTEETRLNLFLPSYATVTAGWNHIQVPLSACTSNNSATDTVQISSFTKAKFDKHSGTQLGTYYFSDVKMIDTDILASLDYADGEWTLAEIGDTEATGTNAPQGSKVVQKEVTSETSNVITSSISCTLPDTYDLKVTEKDKAMSGDDADNLILDFWVCTPSDYTESMLRFWLYLYYGDTEATRLNLYLPSYATVTAGWNHIQVPLSACTSANSEAVQISSFTKVKFDKHSSTQLGTYYFSDIKMIDTDILASLDYADGEWTLAEIGDTEATGTDAPQGSKVVQKDVASGANGAYDVIETNVSCTLPDTYDLKVTEKDKAMSGDDVDNLMLDFWVCTPSDYTESMLRFWLYLYYGGTEETRLNLYLPSYATVTAGWNHIQVPLSACTSANSEAVQISTFTRVKFRTHSTTQGGIYYFSDIKMIDYTSSVEESVYDSTALNYMIFSNLNATSEENQSALVVTKTGNPALVWGNTQYTLNHNVCTDEDVNIKVVRSNSGIIQFYIDDELFGMSATETTALSAPTTAHCIGGDAAGTQIMNGSISNLKVYSDATLSTCIGNWALLGDIQNVTSTMADSSTYANTAVFRGSRADDWSDYQVPDEIVTNQTIISGDDIKAVMPEQSWSLVYIPDMENLTSNDTYNATWKVMAQWIADNAETENIQHIIGGGDTTSDNSETAYARAMEGYQLFMNDVSWSAMVGYNDYAEGYTKRDASNYQATFGEAVIKASAASTTYKGSYVDTESKSTTENSYYRFSVNGVKWMILQLEYAPRTEVLAWADEIVKEYPLDNVILTTPGYLNGYGSKLSIGTTTWNALSGNQNIKMILCGHSTNGTGAIVQATETYSDGTGSVPVLMMNAQDMDAGDDAYYTDRPLGMISILRFSADGTKVAVQYYSPTEGKSFSPDDNYGNADSNNILLTVDTEVCTPVITPYGAEYDTTFEATVAPTDIPTGYIFAGWFTDEACTTALKQDDSVEKAFAKFVDAEVLSVKAQVRLDKTTDADGNVTYSLPTDKTDMRFVTTVDSTNYKEVGFEITANDKDGKPVTITVGSEYVYEYLYAVGKVGTEGATPMSLTPAETCSPQSVLFKTFTVTEIPVARYGEEFTVRAYWITQDGTTVHGDSSVKTVEAGEP